MDRVCLECFALAQEWLKCPAVSVHGNSCLTRRDSADRYCDTATKKSNRRFRLVYPTASCESVSGMRCVQTATAIAAST
jgi:hypothetical protein